MSAFDLRHGDCRALMADMAEASVDAIVTDPPYELAFMGRAWDASGVAFDPATWRAALRVLKPGGHLLAFGGARTYHRMACAIEDAGFDIRDQIMWIYGSGFPKSLDVSKAIDRAAGSEREVLCERVTGWSGTLGGKAALSGLGDAPDVRRTTAPATPEAARWSGWGTALKPAHEPIVMARKPLSGTVAANVMAHGTGGVNIDACRVAGLPRTTHADGNRVTTVAASGHLAGKAPHGPQPAPDGRWPANIIHDGSDEVVASFPHTKSGEFLPHHQARGASRVGAFDICDRTGEHHPSYGDSGSCARFFYCAKASKADRDEGLADFDPQAFVQFQTANGTSGKVSSLSEGRDTQYRNTHPTVKPTALMRYLCRLVTAPGGVVLDPFAGSGSTGKAAILEGFRFVGCELTAEYFPIAEARIARAVTDRREAQRQGDLLDVGAA